MNKLLFSNNLEFSKPTAFQKTYIMLILLVLTLSFGWMTELIMSIFFNLYDLFNQVGKLTYGNIWDSFSLIVPLVLCLFSPKRSGLVIGKYDKDLKEVIFIVLTPIILSIIIYPFAGQPFKNSHVGIWLISPLAQDLLGGFMFGVLDLFFPKSVKFEKFSIKWSLILISILASLWHLPNLLSMQLNFVIFQLFYTFVFAFIIYYTRIWTGSMIPIFITHMSVNFIAWYGF